MRAHCYLSLMLFLAMPAWSQVEPSAYGPPSVSQETMQAPPPVSGEVYPSMTASETRSNQFFLGLSFLAAYNDNLLAGDSTVAVSDASYSMMPSIHIDQKTGRLRQNLTYDSGYTYYSQTSTRNEEDQLVREDFEYLLTPHTTVAFRDSFQKSTNILNQPDSDVSGSNQSSSAQVIAPFADILANAVSGQATYQFGINRMIGGSGISSFQHYPNASQAVGLSNSDTHGGSAFFNLRLSQSQYAGVNYQYSHMTATTKGMQSETPVQTVSVYYTLYLMQGFTLSVSAGPQHFSVFQSTFPSSASWTPAVMASLGWQRMRSNLAASYARSVSGASGLIGVYQTESLRASARYRITRNWILSGYGDYALQKAAVPAFSLTYPGGHGVSGTANAQHAIGAHITAEFGYTRLHQKYAGVSALSKNPDSDRGYVSINYQFTRPLGR